MHKKELDQGDIYESHCTVNVKLGMSLKIRYYNLRDFYYELKENVKICYSPQIPNLYWDVC